MSLNTVPPVTLPPAISFSFTGFQIFAPCGGLNAVPYFHVAGLNGPWFSAPAGAVVRAPLSLPAAAASGNCVAPGAALLAYGSADGAGVCGAGVCPANTTMPTAPNSAQAISRCFTSSSVFGQVTLAGARGQPLGRHAHLQRVHLAIERARREAEHVLMVQLVGDALEGGRQVVGRSQLEIAAAGCRGNLRQPFVRPVRLAEARAAAIAPPAESSEPAAEPAASTATAVIAAAGAAGKAAPREADRVDHHVLFLG